VTPGVSKTLITTLLNSKLQQEGGNTFYLLTDREREIVRLLAEGKSNKEVSARLYISHNTVETHRANSMRKLGVTSIVELVHYAVRNGLIKV
jgi:DNA-binding CsgD family transcriptional regulator